MVCSESVDPPLLELRGISKWFGGVQALDAVDLEVRAGEVVCLVGDNGAGKSTLAKVLGGVHKADQGQLLWRGQQVRVSRPADASALGIQAVYQDPALCNNLDVVSNLFLGQERVTSFLPGVIEPLDEIAMERQAVQVLDELGVRLPSLHGTVASLSGGQRQSVAVVRAALAKAALLVLDEPTTALGFVQTRMLLRMVERVRTAGVGVVFISHNLQNVFDIATQVVVMRLGRRVATFDGHSANAEQVMRAMAGMGARL